MLMNFDFEESIMNFANFNQFLCKNVSENGEDISGIFDTLVCERGRNHFFICVFFTQIIEPKKDFEQFYYRVVLRYLGKTRTDSKHYRVDSGILWNDFDAPNDELEKGQLMHHHTTRPGYSGRLSIDYGFNFEMEGNYEVDLYVKKLSDEDTQDSCDQIPVKNLDLMAISPFQVIFQNP